MFYIACLVFFPKHCVHLVSGILPCKFLHETGSCDMAMCISTAQARTKFAPASFVCSWGVAFSVSILAYNRFGAMSKFISNARARTKKKGCRGLGAWHFPCKFSRKIVLVRCPRAFRRCGLTKDGCHGCWARHFPCKFSRNIALVRCPSAFR